MKHVLIFILLGCITGLLTPFISPVNAGDAVLVKIHSIGEEKPVAFFVNPTELYIDKGTIVVWLSGVRDQNIKVVFEDGKTCKDVTADNSANFFKLDVKGCYVTNFIPFAGTSTLQFTDSGIFEYVVLSQDDKIKASAKIIVR